MKRLYALMVALFAWHVSTSAADVYVCDTPAGKEYRNTNVGRQCKKAELPGLTIVAPEARPGASKTAVVPSSIVVDGDGTPQRTDRATLEQQLRVQEQRLAALRKAYNDGQPERHGDERNYAKYQERVNAMQAELNNTQRTVEALRRDLRQ